jgi:hypothetical protein
MSNILDLLPAPPWEGPPLPRIMGVSWPSGNQGKNSILALLPAFPWEGPPLPRKMGVTWASIAKSLKLPPIFAGSYSNKEEWDVTFSEDDSKVHISVHRDAKRS